MAARPPRVGLKARPGGRRRAGCCWGSRAKPLAPWAALLAAGGLAAAAAGLPSPVGWLLSGGGGGRGAGPAARCQAGHAAGSRRCRRPRPPVARPAQQVSQGLDAGAALGRWWNETYEFWDALELWNAIPLQEDRRAEAVALMRQLDLANATTRRIRERGSSKGLQAAKDREELSSQLAPLPGLILDYYRMRITFTLGKRAVKRGLSSSVLYTNIALAAVFFRVVAPRLLAAGTVDELFDAAGAIGIPDRATLAGYLQAVEDYDPAVKVAAYTLLFTLEKLTMVTEFLPIQIALKTVAPVIFGGLIPGALASAACETLGATCNFLIGRSFLREKVQGASIFGSQPVGEAAWFGKLARAAQEDGLRLTLLLRLAPVLPLPFDSYWYLLGTLPVGLLEFATGHFLGCLKTAFLDASFGVLLLGSVSAAVATGGGDGGDATALQSEAQQIVLVETLAFSVVAVLVGTVATRLINDLLGLEEDSNETPSGQTDEASEAKAEVGAKTARRID